MIVKLRCVDNKGNDCLTVGKVYEGLVGNDFSFSIVDDDGDLITDSPIGGCFYGEWEVVSE